MAINIPSVFRKNSSNFEEHLNDLMQANVYKLIGYSIGRRKKDWKLESRKIPLDHIQLSIPA